jgi:hypothetical protein
MTKRKNKLLDLDGDVIKDSKPEITKDTVVNFKSGAEIADFFQIEEETHVLVVENTFDKILNNWDLMKYIQSSVAQYIANEFTEGQISCIFEIYDNQNLILQDDSGVDVQANLLNYIINRGKMIYNLGDENEYDSFVNRIKSMNPIVFVIFISIIKEHYDAHYNSDYQRQIILGLSNFLQRQSAKVFSNIL